MRSVEEAQFSMTSYQLCCFHVFTQVVSPGAEMPQCFFGLATAFSWARLEKLDYWSTSFRISPGLEERNISANNLEEKEGNVKLFQLPLLGHLAILVFPIYQIIGTEGNLMKEETQRSRCGVF